MESRRGRAASPVTAEARQRPDQLANGGRSRCWRPPSRNSSTTSVLPASAHSIPEDSTPSTVSWRGCAVVVSASNTSATVTICMGLGCLSGELVGISEPSSCSCSVDNGSALHIRMGESDQNSLAVGCSRRSQLLRKSVPGLWIPLVGDDDLAEIVSVPRRVGEGPALSPIRSRCVMYLPRACQPAVYGSWRIDRPRQGEDDGPACSCSSKSFRVTSVCTGEQPLHERLLEKPLPPTRARCLPRSGKRPVTMMTGSRRVNGSERMVRAPVIVVAGQAKISRTSPEDRGDLLNPSSAVPIPGRSSRLASRRRTPVPDRRR